ncbi:MAG: competence/damage-inducible protein A, partial [Proteobacteria bacterium]|nr:competence/damage-inducible protein A [Pseudomonadota bacterium]
MSNTESAEVILVGSELTSGDVDDVNGPFIAQKLLGLGIRVSKISIVGDHEWSIEEAINSALKAIGTHLIIVAGGLGPTSDDITSKIAAKVTGTRLVISNEALEHIREIMAARGKEMHPSQERQSLIPQKAVIINNPTGTACAYKIHHKGKLLIFLPGVPKELAKIFDDVLIPELKEELSVTSEIASKMFHTFGLSEMKVQDM